MMALTNPVMAGNWKMHKDPRETRAFFGDFLERYAPREDRSVLFFPPTVSLAAAVESIRGRPDIRLGVQTIYWEPSGAFTGEISAPLAKGAGAAFTLVGHSERRHVFGESIEDTKRKTFAALAAGLTPVLCVGEKLDERRAGRAEAVVAEQLKGVLATLSGEDAATLLIAYEPVWAIGTGETASPEDAAAMHRAIRRDLRARFGEDPGHRIPILYGGSVKPDNVQALLAADEVEGVLVGGASLDPQGFAAICAAAY
jgi:triosephosphate isomerase (TIM)